VLDITRVVAGPFCSMLLADLGATVIKVEHPDDPDYARTFPPFVSGGEGDFSAFFAQFNRNKQGITLNMKSEEGRALLKTLVRRADVLVENFRPGTMEKLGLGYEVLRQENPRLVYTAISGFGRTGPNSSRPAYDNTGQATGGLWSMNGYPDMPPVRVGTIIGDLAASLYAVIGTLAALREALTRFPECVVIIWLPQLQLLEAAKLPQRLKAAANGAAPKGWLLARLSVQHPRARGFGMLGSLVFVANPPHTLAPALRQALPCLASTLAEDEHAAGWVCETSA